MHKRLSRAESMALTRKRLLAAALETFLRVGYAAATIDGISEEAGFSRGAFYTHFVSKEDIFLEVIASQANETTPRLIAQIKSASSASEMVKIVSQWAEQRSQSQDLAFLMLEVMQHVKGKGPLDARYAQLFNENWRGVAEAMRPFFPRKHLPAEPEEIIAIVAALSYGPIVSGASGHKAGRLVEIVLKGLLKEV